MRRSEREAAWQRMWETRGKEIAKFPEWMQKILLEDIDTAIRNRIGIFEMIQRKVTGQAS